MRSSLCFPFAVIVFSAVLPAIPASAEEAVVSTMRNVNAVMEARGFRLTPAPDMSGDVPFGDEAPILAVEIIRPKGERVTIGRLFTSCSCVQLESHKRTFESGERAILRFRNIKPTPPEGQTYAMYVQLTSPLRTTLRYDTFVQSSRFVAPPPVAAPPIFTAADAGETAPEPEAKAAFDKYGSTGEAGGDSDSEEAKESGGETEAFKAAEALLARKESEAARAAGAIVEKEAAIKEKIGESENAAEQLRRREEETKAAVEALEAARALDALKRDEIKSLESDLEALLDEKELKEREARQASVAVEALKGVGK